MIFLAAIVLSLLVFSRAETTLNPQQLLTAHLNYRAKVAPPASNMQPMTWDSQLAAKAQGYAQKCNWGHNPDRTSPLGKTGENIYMTTGSPSDYSVAVTSWNNEKDYYNYDTNVCQTGKVCGHYTQLVWASSNKVGCGAFRCPKLTGSTSTNALLVVCNYYPAKCEEVGWVCIPLVVETYGCWGAAAVAVAAFSKLAGRLSTRLNQPKSKTIFGIYSRLGLALVRANCEMLCNTLCIK